MPLVTHHDGDQEGDHDDDYDDYNAPNTTVEETTFATPSSTDKQPTSTLQLRQKAERHKLAALCRHLNVLGNSYLVGIGEFILKNNLKSGNTNLLLFDGRNCQSLTNQQTGEFLVPSL